MENNSTVKVTLAEVMDSLKLVSSYLGGKREDTATGYDRVAAIDSDQALVALLMEDAALVVARAFPGRLLRWRYYRASLEFTIEGEADTEGLRPALVRTIALEVLRRWLRITGSDYADAIGESAAEATASLRIYFPESAATGEYTPLRKRARRRALPPF